MLLKPKVAKIVCDALREGNSVKGAAGLAGIHYPRIHEWIKRGDKDRAAGTESVYASFAEGVEKARAQFREEALEAIKRATQDREVAGKHGTVLHRGAWQAAAWLLERKHPEEFGRQQLDVKVDASDAWQAVMNKAYELQRKSATGGDATEAGE